MTKSVKFWGQGIGLEPVSADPVNPGRGQLQYSDGTHRVEGVWRYDGIDWALLSLKIECSAKYTTNSGQSLSSNSIINYEDQVWDTDSAVTTGVGTWKFTVPAGKAGKYLISARASTNVSGWSVTDQQSLAIDVNAVRQVELGIYEIVSSDNSGSSNFIMTQGSTVLDLSAADEVQVRFFHTLGGSIAIRNDSKQNEICITRIGD